jgi:hypothetical protein
VSASPLALTHARKVRRPCLRETGCSTSFNVRARSAIMFWG